MDTDEHSSGLSDPGTLEASVESDKVLSNLMCYTDCRGCSAGLGFSDLNDAWLDRGC